MDIKLKKINDFTQELTCSIPWEEIQDSFKDEFNKVKSNHTPKGGRKGKVVGRDLELFKKNYNSAIEANFAESSSLLSQELLALLGFKVYKNFLKSSTDFGLYF